MSAIIQRLPARFFALLVAGVVAISGAVIAASPASAAGSGSISGMVKDDAGNPVGGTTVNVSHYDAATDSWPSEMAVTGSDGSYTVANLDDGDYRVAFWPGTTDHVLEYWNDAYTEEDATLVPVSGPVTGIDPVLVRAGAISGTVTDSDGTPVQNAFVIAYGQDLPGSAGTSLSVPTDVDGTFAITGLRPGAYLVQYTTWDTTANVTGEWWNNAMRQDDAAIVSVTGGSTTSQIDAELAQASSISGIVTDPSGSPVEGVDVTAYLGGDEEWDWNWTASVQTDANGAYQFRGLSAGDYKIQYGTDALSTNLAGTWWGGANSVETATAISLGSAADLGGIDAHLAFGATISGTVVDGEGAPLADIHVSARADDGSGAAATTDSNGEYTLTRLPATSYLVDFSDFSETYVTQWWNGATNWDDGTMVDLTAGQEIAGIDARLTRAGAIAGTVRDSEGNAIEGVSAVVYGSDGNGNGTSTDSEGHYRLGGLAPGDYKVRFDTEYASSNVASEWWQDADTESDATVITVSAGSTVDDISPELGPGATISGHVVDGDDHPLTTDTYIEVHRGDSDDVFLWLWTDSEGAYTARGLPAGEYRLGYGSTDDSYTTLTEWWNNKPSRQDADPISLTVGQSVQDVDVTLSVDDHSVRDTHTGTLSGVVKDAAGQPLEGVQVDITDPLERGGDGTWTDAAGKWSFNILSVGDYIVKFTATIDGAQVIEYWEGAADRQSATIITLADGQVRHDIDAVLGEDSLVGIPLSPVPTISGTARSGETLTASTGAWTAGTALAYQWLANGTPIDGATAATLALTPALVGAQISVRVTGTLDGYANTERVSSTTGSVAAPVLPGVTPTITGSVVVGATLTARPGVWPDGTGLTYQWLANGSAIAGATAPTFAITASQLAKKLSVRVTGTLSGYESVSRTSAATAAVRAGILTASKPSISGTVAVGSTVTAKPGRWTAGVTFAYQWYANGKAIKGATKSTYKIASSLKGKRLSVKVTGRKAGYTTVTTASSSTAKVPKAGGPGISGKASVGSRLTAKTGSWTSGTKFSYQWYADGKAISKATKKTYKVGGSTIGKAITVKITGKKSGYVAVAKTSKATPRVPKAGKPSISGVKYVTGTLTVSPGAWTTGTSYSYRWYVNGKAIKGATKSTLSLRSSFSGKKITVKVTGRKGGYTTVTTTSAAVKIKPGKAKPKSKYTCPAGYPIKGNQTTRHTTDWIYHVPGGQYYAVTAPEECFATEAAARQAHYRASLR